MFSLKDDTIRKVYKGFLHRVIMTFGIENNKEHPYEQFKGKEVRVHLTNQSAKVGILHHWDKDFLYLSPFLINESLETSKGTKTIAKIEIQAPALVKSDLVSILEPLFPGYIETYAQSVNSSSFPNRIVLARGGHYNKR